MPALLLSILTALSTVIGGLLPLYTLIQQIGSRYLLGFAAGAMLSVAFLAMLPELGKVGEVPFLALALGFFGVYLAEKLIIVHSCPEGECEFHTIGWTSLIGIAAESLLDGVAIAVGYSLAPGVGITIALAVIAHEFPRGFTTVVIMKTAGYPRWKVLGALALDALLTPVGVVLVLLGVFPEGLFAPLLAFAAGTFIYVGASDLLPEAHRHWNIWVVVSVVLGVLIIPGLEVITGI